jgi:hypothetical protein
MHARIAGDAGYLRVDPISSRKQYHWMKRFITTVEESEFRTRLVQAIDGKGAFRRFKDVLMAFPVDRERWFTFRSERLRTCMEGWLETHGIEAVVRPQWEVPSADDVRAHVDRDEHERPARRARAQQADAQRRRLHELSDALHARDLDAALAFLEFLRERRHVPRERGRGEGGPRDGALVTDADRDDALDADHDDVLRDATDGPLQAD